MRMFVAWLIVLAALYYLTQYASLAASGAPKAKGK
jgi:hypothetical protein